MSAEFVVGIDLGTTNSVLAYAPLDRESPCELQMLAIPQLTAVGTIESEASLPSFVYLCTEDEATSGALDLPWAHGRKYAVGQWARRQAADCPDRSVGAAKSWLGYAAVDRHDPILPWGAPAENPKISPLDASRYYLEHLVAAWNRSFPNAPLEQQRVVLTVPASFDASARELTREAALQAGLPDDVVLLEEPQAAVYAWLSAEGDHWRQRLHVGDRLLVCDIGGGTTDLTLIEVNEDQGELSLSRQAVGNHLLVGGDNMDLALAHHVAEQIQAQGIELDPWQSVSLWHACRTAKETLLAAYGPDTHPVSVLGRGSRLIGGTISTTVNREVVERLLVDGFFPVCELTDAPQRQRQSGFVQLGLPFETDTRITRHIGHFLLSHGAGTGAAIQPTHVLYNGGVFAAAGLRQRMTDVLSHWFPGTQVTDVTGKHYLDTAVARGAAFYGWTKEQGGLRIRGGTARSYYIGMETAGLAIPGAPRPLRAICVVPFGMEEGSAHEVPTPPIGLVLGEPVQFRFFSSSVRKHDQPGMVLNRWTEEELQETDSLEAELPASDTIQDVHVPVRFESRVTELGMFELWCVSTKSPDRWKLEFNVRKA